MKLHVALCALLFAGCATTSSPRVTKAEQASLKDGAAPGGSSQQQAELVRVETPAGAFLVSPPQVEDFKKVLSGDPTPASYSADVNW